MLYFKNIICGSGQVVHDENELSICDQNIKKVKDLVHQAHVLKVEISGHRQMGLVTKWVQSRHTKSK